MQQTVRRKMAVLTMAITIASCSKSPDIITDTKPFSDEVCQYGSVSTLLRSAKEFSERSRLRFASKVWDEGAGVFSIDFGMKDLTVSISGIPTTRDIHLSAYKKGDVSSVEAEFVKIAKDILKIRCNKKLSIFKLIQEPAHVGFG